MQVAELDGREEMERDGEKREMPKMERVVGWRRWLRRGRANGGILKKPVQLCAKSTDE